MAFISLVKYLFIPHFRDPQAQCLNTCLGKHPAYWIPCKFQVRPFIGQNTAPESQSRKDCKISLATKRMEKKNPTKLLNRRRVVRKSTDKPLVMEPECSIRHGSCFCQGRIGHWGLRSGMKCLGPQRRLQPATSCPSSFYFHNLVVQINV